MKTKITLLFLALVLTASAQLSLVTNNLSDVRRTSDSIALNAKRVFKYEKEAISKNDMNYYLLKYSNTSDAEYPMVVAFRIKMIGSNPDLEITGTPEYSFYKVSGKFLDLFPFWVKFMNPQAIAASVSQKKEDKATINGQTYYIKEDGSVWQIIRY
ncbi:MAG: hypothetical protein WCG93_12095 [Paludibacter sp.]